MNCEIKINKITIKTPFLLYANLDTKYIVYYIQLVIQIVHYRKEKLE
jgi:hypothetical protein